MLIKYDAIDGSIISVYPEMMVRFPNKIGRVNIFEDGNQKFATTNEIYSCLVIGKSLQKYLAPDRLPELYNFTVSKDGDNFIITNGEEIYIEKEIA